MKCQHADLAAMRDEVELLRADLARCREVQKATAEGWRHEVAEVASIVGAPPHTAELAACVRAEVERLRRERDEALVESAQKALSLVAIERDEAQAEVETLRGKLEYQAAEAASWRATARDKGYSAREVAKERDEARAEVERLRAEVQAAREALGLAWCSDGSPLADGIRRKTHALESLIR